MQVLAEIANPRPGRTSEGGGSGGQAGESLAVWEGGAGWFDGFQWVLSPNGHVLKQDVGVP